MDLCHDRLLCTCTVDTMNAQLDFMQQTTVFDGPVYDPRLDRDRLEKQIGRVYDVMEPSRWLTLSEIAGLTGDPEASVSAQLRHLRKPRFGNYLVQKRRRGLERKGLWEYRMLT